MNEFNCNNLIDLSFETDTEKLLAANNNDPMIIEGDNRKLLLATTAPTAAATENSITIKDESTHNIDLMMDGSFISSLKCTTNNSLNHDDDPFDKMEKEALSKAKQIKNQMECNTKLGKLLSLSDDNDDDEQLAIELDDTNKRYSSKIPIENCEEQCAMWTSENTSCPLYSNKLTKSTAYQKNLLKFSLTNSALGTASPLNKLIPLDNALNTPVSSLFLRKLDLNEPLLAAESPLKLIDDDDDSSNHDDNNEHNDVDVDALLECSSISNVNVDDEKKFEADLEMLKIPILQELSTSKVTTNNEMKLNSPTINTNFKDEQNDNKTLNNDEDILSKVVPSLEAIKAKLECKRNQNKQSDISDLINHIKEIMITDESSLNQEKKQEVTELLENLKAKIVQTSEKNPSCDPQFNERDDNKELNIREDMPHCMVSSTSTYDGETEPQDELKRPEIISSTSMENLSDIKSSSSLSSSPRRSIHSDQTDLNEIVEKLTKALTKADESSTHSTVILVMQTPTSSAKDKVQQTDDHSPTSCVENIIPRRRSQSLSIHDTIKILQFPPPANKTVIGTSSTKVKDSRYSTVGSPKSKSEQLLRRNSFSGGNVQKPEIVSKQNKAATATTNMNYKSQQQQPQSVIKSMNMPILRPDPKRKLKLPTESIMKSSCPLKATIPIKKLINKSKTTSPVGAFQSRDSTGYNNNRDNLTMNVASTPTQMKRNVSLSAVGNPKAFSTPHHSTATTCIMSTSSNATTVAGAIKKSNNPHLSSVLTNTRGSLMPSSVNFAATKRRTTSDLKIKSSGKITKASARVTTATATTTSAAAAAVGVNRIRPTSSFTSTNSTNTISNQAKNRNIPRASMGQARLTSKNKENK